MKATIFGVFAVGLCGWGTGVNAAGDWEQDFERAKTISARTGKPIFLTFR